jgi:hypothetical protein
VYNIPSSFVASSKNKNTGKRNEPLTFKQTGLLFDGWRRPYRPFGFRLRFSQRRAALHALTGITIVFGAARFTRDLWRGFIAMRAHYLTFFPSGSFGQICPALGTGGGSGCIARAAIVTMNIRAGFGLFEFGLIRD